MEKRKNEKLIQYLTCNTLKYLISRGRSGLIYFSLFLLSLFLLLGCN